MEQNSQKGNTLLIVIITVIITAVLVGGGIFLYLYIQNLNEEAKTAKDSAQTTKTATQEPTFSPSQIIDNYTKATISTIPGSNVNDTEAKTYLTDGLKAQYTDATFPKTSYGIVNQNWPNKIKIDSESIGDNSGNIKISGNWSDVSTSWEDFCTFTLVKEDNEWKISNIENHLEDDEYRIPEGF